jgi:hypothetical protein
MVSVSGNVSYCSDPNLAPVPNVTLTVNGDTTTSVVSDTLGDYLFPALEAGWSYTVTPTKNGRVPGSSGITTEDVIAIQQHILQITPLTRCRLQAADVNGDNGVNTVDRIAVERFYLGMTTGTANVGRYRFAPANRTYPTILTDQTDQNYDTLVFGDVAPPFVEDLDGPVSPAGDNAPSSPAPAAVAALSLPNVSASLSVTSFTAPVTTAALDPRDDLVGFQGDFIFDSTVVSFQDPPVREAGLTARDWNISANVLPGEGNLRTLRVSAFSKYFAPLRGSGTLFELRMTRVSRSTDAVTQFVWAAPPDNFVFIDYNLQRRVPQSTAPGSVRIGTTKAKSAPPSRPRISHF